MTEAPRSAVTKGNKNLWMNALSIHKSRHLFALNVLFFAHQHRGFAKANVLADRERIRFHQDFIKICDRFAAVPWLDA